MVVCFFYLLSVWFHFPYGGGHIYSDIVSVFQGRFCPNQCNLQIPYTQVFVEYPIIVSMFMWFMGVLGNSYTLVFHEGNLIGNYYYFTTAALAIPTFLSINELEKISSIIGISKIQRRILLYFVATPTFLFMLHLNWYIIGVYFMVFGLRKFLEGGRVASGILLGLSLASNLVTAVPALGMFYILNGTRSKFIFASAVGLTYFLLNLPFIILNPTIWFQFWSYHANWYTEGSWINIFFDNLSPYRHVIFPILFIVLSLVIFIVIRRLRASEKFQTSAVKISAMFMFAFLFSTYVSTPQMNLMLLPFFVLLPISKRYWEFLAFDIVNSLVIVVGFSQPLQIFDITLHVQAFGYWSIIQWFANIRSLWIGKFLVFDLLANPTSPVTNVITKAPRISTGPDSPE